MHTNQLPDRNRSVFLQGARDAIPIGLGYLAVSFSLGITAKNIGLGIGQAFLASFLCNASAGEYAGFTIIAAGGTYLEMALITLIANARYLLMSCALSQRMSPALSIAHRMLIGFDVTDEVFAITIARPGTVNPFYSYGAMCVAIPGWAVGTALGALMGSLLPARLVSALSVALYGMFLAIIIPPARKNKIIAGIILVCFATSFAASLPLFSFLSSGTKTIILTVVISVVAALLFPVADDENGQEVQA